MDGFNSNQNITPEEAEIEEIREAVTTAIKALRAQLEAKAADLNVKAVVADLLKLLQLRKELEGDRPRYISARWIDEDEC